MINIVILVVIQIAKSNQNSAKYVIANILRVVFSKDQKTWNLDESDLDENRTTHAVGHNSG